VRNRIPKATPYLDKRDRARQHAVDTLCIKGGVAAVDGVFLPDVLFGDGGYDGGFEDAGDAEEYFSGRGRVATYVVVLAGPKI
jgi:hypothetical protein